MGITARAMAFTERNRGALVANAWRQALVRPWVRFRLWTSVGRLFAPRLPDRWLFIGGCYNSGTTILREMLGAHPEIGTLPREGVELTSVFPDIEQGGWQRMWHRNADLTDLSHADPKTLARQAARDWAPWWPNGKRVFLEKSIIHGAWMPVLEAGFENCRFVGVVRNGLCAAEGIRRRAHPSGNAADELGANTYPIEEAAAQWVASNQRLLEDREKVSNFLEIRYEDLTADPIATLVRLFRFVGVDEHAARDLGGGVIAVGKRRFTIRDDNPASIARLTSSDRAAHRDVAGPMMVKLGYDGAPR
ncbi:sulfotransferase family protein [Maritimibacter dapengensis]|uniref:Sulfotransferase n=1 Tax=Maritimibacter dapengensis TaxID=2836868 RepID=A0ABS6T4M2_9RHOB|nr:sulfotransferase [Maritimibacter dapengensis]MBV7380168.1 sulfotransferase [Maritimibacter dapengensis]